jgi:hypothetical protein
MIPEVIKMVSGTLALKNGYYYAVLSYQDAAGKRPQKLDRRPLRDIIS